MSIYRDFDHLFEEPSVVALGCFDGVHSGHAEVLSKAKKIAMEKGRRFVVWTFEEPVRNYFCPGSVRCLTDADHKIELLLKLGADDVVCFPFNDSVAALSPRDFVHTILHECLKAEAVVCGWNYTFGFEGKGTTADLTELCSSEGIGTYIVNPVLMGGQTVSSSLVRDYLNSGDMKSVSECLGRNFTLRSEVINGQHLAGKLGFPTVNQVFSENQALPKNGVYISRVRFDGRIMDGISNIGIRPTVDGSLLCAETHIFDLSENLYGRVVEIEPYEFIRSEQVFPDLDHLRMQIEKDIVFAKNRIRDMVSEIIRNGYSGTPESDNPDSVLVFKERSVDHPDSIKMMEELNDSLIHIVGHNGTMFVNLSDFSMERAVFIVGYIDDKPVCCAGIREMDQFFGEVKRVYAQINDIGIGSRLMSELDSWARDHGYSGLKLECRRINQHAISFYMRNGYSVCENYEPYIGVEDAVCMEKLL